MIHETAIIEEGAIISADVEIGPYTVIGAHVEIGEGTWIGPHVVINGHTQIGTHNKIYQFSSIGEANQDKKYNGEPTKTVIGDHNHIREFTTIHRGTAQDLGVTSIGSHNLLMAYVHVAHDCTIHDHCILANNATIAGHVVLEDWVILGGFTGIHQFCHIGAHAFTAMSASIAKDVPPFVMADGHPALPRGLNIEGLKRRNFNSEQIKLIKQAYKILYRSGHTLSQALDILSQLEQETASTHIRHLIDFIDASDRGIIR